jgi:tetratricopeptide (TPR) repeat protein
VGRIIRICSKLALLVPLLAPMLAPAPVAAKRLDASALAVYARARVADGQKDSASAVANYNAALTMASDATTVAFRAYRAGVDGGDYRLAVRAAQALDRLDIVPPDARVLLYVAAVRDRDWVAARTRLDQLRNQDGFGFLVPLFGGWLALATGAPEDTKPTGDGNLYSPENNALLGIARGRYADSATAIRTLWPTDPDRARPLRLAAAFSLAARKQRDLALSLLTDDDPAVVAARATIARGKPTAGRIDTPARAIAYILARMADDLVAQGSNRSAITLARLANFADADNARVTLAAVTALGAAKRHREALGLVETVRRDPVYADAAASMRIELLEALGRFDEAYAAAGSGSATSPAVLSRLGDLAARNARYVQAAGHYRRAISAVGADKAGAGLWLALGNALDLGGDWPGARPALERALKLSPDDPRLLNQLGYGMVVRDENVGQALVLLRRANDLQPENAAITDSLGWAEYRRGDITRATAILERARMLDPVESEIAEHLGDVYWAGGRRIEARYAWAAARIGATADVAARLDGKIDRGLR